ncbi:MAG: RNA polymerase sigma factor [Bacteroidota bacterium]
MALKVTWKKIREQSDEELLERFLESGDNELLGELYSRYMHLVYGVCLRYFDDRERSKDAVMQIFEKLVTELPKHEVRTFRSWLYVLTKNFCLMELRSDRSKEVRYKKFAGEQKNFVENEPFLHPVDEENAGLNRALQQCIERLKDEQRQCIRLFYFEEKSYREISALLEMDEKKVKSLLQNGKRNLKICMDQQNVG